MKKSRSRLAPIVSHLPNGLIHVVGTIVIVVGTIPVSLFTEFTIQEALREIKTLWSTWYVYPPSEGE